MDSDIRQYIIELKRFSKPILRAKVQVSDGKSQELELISYEDSGSFKYSEYFKEYDYFMLIKNNLKVNESVTNNLEICDEYFATKTTTRIH